MGVYELIDKVIFNFVILQFGIFRTPFMIFNHHAEDHLYCYVAILLSVNRTVLACLNDSQGLLLCLCILWVRNT